VAAAADPGTRGLRLFIAARSRVAEDALAAAVGRGVRQAVVLGAGLDTLALRAPHAGAGLRTFEVDHPAAQAWKRDRLAQLGLRPPATLTFVPVDFEHDDLPTALRAAGFRDDRPAFFAWLGVVPYLTRAAVTGTLRAIAAVPGAEVVFDYTEPDEHMTPGRRARAAALADRVAAAGEPLVTRLDPGEVARELRVLGFADVEDLGPADLAVRLFGRRREDAPAGGGPHVVRAALAAPA
jgi:methyltransferase (TIGR00027 family)